MDPTALATAEPAKLTVVVDGVTQLSEAAHSAFNELFERFDSTKRGGWLREV